MKAIRIYQHGGPEVLQYQDAPVPDPGPGEALVEIHVSGVNFVDTYVRSGLYKPPSIPFTPGAEGAGIVSKVGSGVSDVRVGDRVAYATSMGSYAEFAAVPTWKLASLPDSVDFRAGAAIMLQGMTAHYLTTSTYPLKSGQTALVHAGAGGVGLLLIQIARKIGARVIATVGTAEKGELARAAGAHEIIIYSQQDFEAEVKKMTNGCGCRSRLRCGRRRDMGKKFELPEAARLSGPLRKCQRTGSSIRSPGTHEGVAICDPADSHSLRIQSRRGSIAKPGSVRLAEIRRTEAEDRLRVSTGRCGKGADRT